MGHRLHWPARRCWRRSRLEGPLRGPLLLGPLLLGPLLVVRMLVRMPSNHWHLRQIRSKAAVGKSRQSEVSFLPLSRSRARSIGRSTTSTLPCDPSLAASPPPSAAAGASISVPRRRRLSKQKRGGGGWKRGYAATSMPASPLASSDSGSTSCCVFWIDCS